MRLDGRGAPQGTWTQLKLFEQVGSVCHGASGEGATGAAAREEGQVTTALSRERALTSRLIEKVYVRESLNRAYMRVKSSKGAPGIDGMTVVELYGWIKEHGKGLNASRVDESHEPQSVKAAEIPKPSGGTRELGIPMVVDPIIDTTFSESSYGFRRGRCARRRSLGSGGRSVGEVLAHHQDAQVL